MKKLLSLVLCALLLLTPVLGAAAEEDASLLDQLWALSDLSFLVEAGVLTEDEAAMLSADLIAVENGRELVRTAKIGLNHMYGDETLDAALAALLERVTFVERAQRNEETLTILLDGEEAVTLSLGEQDGLYVLGSNLLPGAVSLTAEDLSTLPNRLVTAAQANGLVSSQEAMQFGMMTSGYAMPFGMSMPWWVSLLGYEAELPELDLTAWNAVLTGVQSRMAYTDRDDGTRMWSVTVTPKDVTDFLRAGLITVRDNPALADMLAEALGYNRTASLYGSMGSFTQEVIDPMLTELDDEKNLLPLQLDIRGYLNAQGGIDRVEIDMLDASESIAEVTTYTHPETDMDAEIGDTDTSLADYFALPTEPVLMMTIVYNRSTSEDGTVYEVTMGDHEYTIYCEYCEAPGSYVVTMGSETEGVRTEEIRVSFTWGVTRTDDATTIVADFLYQYPTTDYTWNDDGFEYNERTAELAYSLEAYVSGTGFSLCLTGLNSQDEVPLRLNVMVDCVVDGVDLVGMEHGEVKYGDDVVFTYASDLRTQDPAGSILEADALRLSGMTDEELTAWVAQVKANAEAWFAAQQNGWVGELVELIAVPAPEEETAETYEMKVDELSAMLGNVYMLETSGLDDWSAEIVEGADVVEFGDMQLMLDEQNPEASEFTGLFFTGLKEGEATVVVTEHSTPDDHPEGMTRTTTISLSVDAQGIVEILESSTRTVYGVAAE